jgi:DNA-binding IclR family transcriptional regulator
LAVLDLFVAHKELGLTEISRLLSLDKSNVFRIAITLENGGFIEKTQNVKYKLGTKLLYLGNLVQERQEIVSIARPFLQKLAGMSKECTFLAVLIPDMSIIFIAKEVSKYSMQMRSTIGIKMPVHTTADGKALLAFSPQATVDKFLEENELLQRTENTIVSKDEFSESLKQIRTQGYAFDNEETEKGLISIAAPIRNISDRLVASVSVTGPIYRMMDNREALTQEVMQTADEISQALGRTTG